VALALGTCVKTTHSITNESAPVPAFDEFFNDWFPDLARAMALIVRDLGDGQEIAQEGFIRLYRNWSKMRSPEHARNFVFRASINLARTHLRRRRPLALVGFGRTELFGSVADRSEISNDRIVFADALARLSRRQRECVVLVDYLGHDGDSVGRILGLAPPTVRVHLARGRAQLRKHLSERKEER
jgi:RNA polymerase sigma factor (sigma-70 family)